MSQSKCLFSNDEDEKLIEIVEKFPCIYDISNSAHKDQNIVDNALKEISEIMGRSVEDCKKRWRNIKDTYQKRQKKGKGTGSSAASKGKKWPLAEMLTFLNKVDHKRQSTSNIPCASVEDHQAEAVAECVETAIDNFEDSSSKENAIEMDSFQPPIKRLRARNDRIVDLLEIRRVERQQIINSIIQKKEDEIDLFFRSVAMSVKKLKPEFINEAKMRSLQLVFELEQRNQYMLNQSPASTSNMSPTFSSLDSNSRDYTQL